MKICSRGYIRFKEGGSHVNEKSVVVTCEFDANGRKISDILEESFVLFLNRTFANPQGNTIQYPR